MSENPTTTTERLLGDYGARREHLVGRLTSYRRHRQWVVLVTILAAGAAGLAGGVLAFLLWERTPLAGETSRTVAGMAWYLGVLVVGVLAAFAWTRVPSPPELATELEGDHPALGSLLITAAEIAPDDAVPVGASPALARLTVALADERSRPLPFRPTGRQRARFLALVAVLCALTPLMIWHWLSPIEVRTGCSRLWQPWAAIAPFSQISIAVTPGDLVVPRGESVQVAAVPNHPLQRPPVLHLLPLSSVEDGGAVDPGAGYLTDMYLDEAATETRYVYTLTNLAESTDYEVRYERFSSPRYHLTVVPRPELKRVKISLRYPAYLEKPDRVLPDGHGDLEGPVGSVVQVEGESSVNLSAAWLAFAPPKTPSPRATPQAGTASGSESAAASRPPAAAATSSAPNPGGAAIGGASIGESGTGHGSGDDDGHPTLASMTVDGARFRGEFTLATSTRYWIDLRGPSGLANLAPVKYTALALEDATPSVTIVKPGADVMFPKSKRLDLKVEGRDDFGIITMVLYYRIGIRRDPIPLNLKADFRPMSEVIIDYPWLLDTIAVEPGTELSYYVEVEDGYQPKPHVATSTTWRLRLPSLLDVMDATNQAENRLQERVKRFHDQERERYESIKKTMSDLKHQGQLDAKTEAQLQEAIQQGEARLEESKQLLEDAKQLEERIRDNQLSDPRNLEKMVKLNELLNEVLDDEAKRLMKQLQESLEQVKLDPKEIQKFAENFKMDEYLQQLDRSIEVLSRLREERQMMELDQAVTDLLRRQQAIASETAELERRRQQGGDPLTPAEEKRLAELEQKLRELQRAASEAAALRDQQADGRALDASQTARLQELERQAAEAARLASEAAALRQKQAESKLDERQLEERLKELRDQQRKIAEELANLQKQAENLAEQLDQDFKQRQKTDPGAQQRPGQQALENLRDRMKQEPVDEHQKQVDQGMQQKKLDQAQQGQQKLLTFLRALKQNSERVCQQCGQQGQQMQLDLSQYVQRALQVSFDQEELMNRLDGVPPQFMRGHLPELEGRVNEVSVRQLLVKRAGAGLEAELELFLRQNIMLDADLLQPIRGCDAIFSGIVKDLEDRAVGRAVLAQRDIIRRFNRLAIELLKAQDQAGQQGGSEGSLEQMMQSFKQMTRRQLQLNQMTQQMQQMSPGDRQLMEQMKRMAQEQRRLREQLQELMREGRHQQQLRGRLDDITRDMEDIETRLLEGRMDRKLTEQQKSVYERMLRAQKSLQQREEESEERKANAPEQALRQLEPKQPVADPQRELVDLAKEYIGAGKDEYPQAYESMLRDYYKSLSLEGVRPGKP